jgi:hypothetical protein
VPNFRDKISIFQLLPVQNEQPSRLHFSAIILSFRDTGCDKFYPDPSRACCARLTRAMGSLLHGRRTQSGFPRALYFPISQQKDLLGFLWDYERSEGLP